MTTKRKVPKPRVFSEEFKLAAVDRHRKGESASSVAFDLKISRKLLYDWKSRVDQGKKLGARGRPADPVGKAYKDQSGEIAKLQQMLGKLTAENHFFRSALRKLNKSCPPNNGSGTSAQ